MLLKRIILVFFCEFYYLGIAIDLSATLGVNVSNCIFRNCGKAIDANTVVTNTIIDQCGTGIYGWGNVIINNSIISNCTTGALSWPNGIQCSNSIIAYNSVGLLNGQNAAANSVNDFNIFWENYLNFYFLYSFLCSYFTN